ncbi:MAG: putative transposase [Motiliproteus sp.]|jgi:putative transposase
MEQLSCNRRVSEPSVFLTTDWLLSGFGLRKNEALARYQQFISEGKGQPSVWKLLRNQVFLGSDLFVERAQSLLKKDSMLSEIPSSQRRPLPKSLDAYKESYTNRNTFIIKAYESGGYTLKEIGDCIGLHYSTVSGIIKSHKSKT